MTQPLLSKKEIDTAFAPVYQIIDDQLSGSAAIKANLQSRIIDVVTAATSSQIATSEQADGKFPETQCIMKIRSLVNDYFPTQALDTFGNAVGAALQTLYGRAVQLDPNVEPVVLLPDSNHTRVMLATDAQREANALAREQTASPEFLDVCAQLSDLGPFNDFNLEPLAPAIPTDEEIQANPLKAAQQMTVALQDAEYDGEEITADSPTVKALDKALNALDAKYPETRGDINALIWQNLTDEERAAAAEMNDPDYCGHNYFKHPRALENAIYFLVERSVTDLYQIYGTQAEDATFFMDNILNTRMHHPAERLAEMKPEELQGVAVETDHKPRIEAFLQRLPEEMRNTVFGQLYANLSSEGKQKAEGHPTYCSENYMDHLEELQAAIEEHVPAEIIHEERARIFEEIAEFCNTVIELNPLAAVNHTLFTVLNESLRQITQLHPGSALDRAYEEQFWNAEAYSDLPTLAQIKEVKAFLANLQARVADQGNYILTNEVKTLYLAIKKMETGRGWDDSYDNSDLTEAELEAFKAFIGVDRFNDLKGKFYQDIRERMLQDIEDGYSEEARPVLDAMEADADWAGNNLIQHMHTFMFYARGKIDETIQAKHQEYREAAEATDKSRLASSFLDSYDTRDTLFENLIIANPPELKINGYGLTIDYLIDIVIKPRFLAE